MAERPVAVVTGAARGIGAAAARRLAADGFAVVALDVCTDDPALDYALATEADLAEVVEQCGPEAEGVILDVRDRGALVAALAGLPVPAAVVCAAGCVWGGPPVWDTPEPVMASLFDTNVAGVVNTAAATIPRMLTDGGSGRFVAVASAAGSRGLPRMGAYAAAKHAVIGLVRSLAADLATTPITANAVAPGSTDTSILAASASVYDLASPEEFAVHHLSGRLLAPEVVAAAVAWLCSPDASGVTGSVLAVDAGMTAT